MYVYHGGYNPHFFGGKILANKWNHQAISSGYFTVYLLEMVILECLKRNIVTGNHGFPHQI